MTFKEQVYNECVQILNKKINFLKQTLSDLKESASNETKSTAGDKHETALAMLQIEQENANKQLENLLLQKLSLQKLSPLVKCIKVSNGALVETSSGYFYISIALGKLNVRGRNVIALSPQSPLGSKLIGLSINDRIVFNGTTYTINMIE